MTKEKYVIKETTLYSVFSRLEKNELITSYPGEVTHGKKRTYYKITKVGLDYLNDKKQEWQLTKAVVDQFMEGN